MPPARASSSGSPSIVELLPSNVLSPSRPSRVSSSLRPSNCAIPLNVRLSAPSWSGVMFATNKELSPPALISVPPSTASTAKSAKSANPLISIVSCSGLKSVIVSAALPPKLKSCTNVSAPSPPGQNIASAAAIENIVARAALECICPSTTP